MSKNMIKNITYGAVEDIDVTSQNPYKYSGYCKKLGSDEICEIEVFINDELVDTLKADKLVASVDKTYGCGNHCFEYEADEALFDKGNVIRFKNGGEDILGSPMEMKYNEHCFMQSLKEPIDKEELKNSYTPNVIGFLATKENLDNEDFMGYVKELMERFPDVEFKGFCFTQEQRELAAKIPCNAFKINSIEQLVNNIEVFVYNVGDDMVTRILPFLRDKCQNIMSIGSYFKYINYSEMTVRELEDKLSRPTQLFMKNLDKLGFTKEEISDNETFTQILYHTACTRFNLGENKINEKSKAKEAKIKLIEYSLLSKKFKEFYFELAQEQLKIVERDRS